MPKMRVTDLGRRRLYLTRHMWASDDEAYLQPEVVEAARALGYVEDIAPEVPAAPRRRTRAMKTKDTKPLEELKVRELRTIAEEKGIDLPSGYVKHDDLVSIVKEADQGGGEDDDAGRF